LELSFVALETGKINGKEATELSTKLFFSWDIAEYVYCGGFRERER
jgi:hypothetical protein